MPWFDLITGGLLGEQNPYDAVAQWSNEQQRKNRAAVGLDANGNPLPTNLDANGNPVAPAAASDAVGAATGQALANSQLQPGQQPQSTKTDPSLGALLMQMTQYQQREQGFNQALGAGFGAISQPRDREWVSKIFNVNEPDVNAIGQQQMNLASQQQGQDRNNSIGLMLQGPQALQIATALNMPGSSPAEKIAALQAAYRADPQNIGRMISQTQQPTDPMKNLQQIQTYLQSHGASTGDLSLLTPSLVAAVGPEFAQKAIGDAVTYRSTHGGKNAPWVGPGGVNVQAYNQWTADQKTVSDSQADASSTLSGNIAKTETLRQKISDLQNNPGLQKVLALPNDSPMKIAARDALRSEGDSWQNDVVHYGVLLNDPAVMKAISELKEINGQEYTGAIDSLLGHGLRPSQTEVTAVREGFGQTKNLLNFSNMKDYTAQAIQPMLTRLDEAEATGYGASGSLKNAPERVRPFIHPVYLTGGKMHLDDGAAPEDWESQINKPMPSDLAAKAQARIQAEPWNAFAIRDGLRRKGYRVDF